jgi:hypothetical protein
VIGPLALGHVGESPWWWLIIPVAAASFLLGRSRSRKIGRPMPRRPTLWLADMPWWQQAALWAILGGGLLYQLATGHIRGYWWVLSTVAWLMFAIAVVRRKPQ